MTSIPILAERELRLAAEIFGLSGLTFLARGAENHVFEAVDRDGNAVVVKVCAGGRRARYDTATWAARQLSLVGVPAPLVLWSGNHVCVERRCPGTSLAGQSPRHPGAQLRVAEQVGRALRQIHAIEVHGYGRLNHAGIGEYEDIHSWLVRPLPDLADAAGLPDWPRLCDTVRRTLLHHARLFDGVPPRLAHGDLRARHVYATANGTLTGLIDLESVRGADPLTDLAGWSLQEPEPLTSALMHGYLDNVTLDNKSLIRLSCYRLRIAVRLVVWHSETGEPSWAELHLRQIENDLQALAAGTPMLLPTPTPSS